MSRMPRFVHRPGRPWQAALWTLAGMNLLLLAYAAWMGQETVTDGEGAITTGNVVAIGIAGTLALAAAFRLLPFPEAIVVRAQVFALGAQALHAVGHLGRLYYVLGFYDDLLHFWLVFAVGLLVLQFARHRLFLFTWRRGPWRVAILVWLFATAAAGLWEIFEFSMDVLLGTREQDNLPDTMIDMIDGTLGGALAGALAWREVRAEQRAKRLADARSDELLD